MNIITNDILIENITRFRGGQLFNQTGSSTTPMSPCIVLFNNEQVKAGFVNPSHSNIDFTKAVMVLALGIPGGGAGQAINQAPNNESVTAYAKPFLYWPKKDIETDLPLTADIFYTPDPEGFPAVNISFNPSASYLIYVGSVLYTNTFNAQGITSGWSPFSKPGDELTPVLYKNIWYRLTSDKAYALTNGFTLLFVQRRFYSDTDKDVDVNGNGNGISNIPDSIVFNTYALITAPYGGLGVGNKSGYVPNGSGDKSTTTTLKNNSIIVAYDSLPIPVATTTELSSGLLFTYVLAL